MSNAQVLVERLARVGVTTFFGVQGGGSAHLIEAACRNNRSKFIPSLNEQAAGLSAHGHFFSSGAAAGAISTCGPGFLNLITGIAACYYDNIPAVFLVGQVGSGANLAQQFGTKMYGFQESPHSEIAAFVAEKSLKVCNEEDFAVALKAIDSLHHVNTNGPLVIELQDDFQRMDSEVADPLNETSKISERPSAGSKHSPAVEQISELITQSSRPLFMVGSGVSRAAKSATDCVDRLSKNLGVPTVFTWGGQRLKQNDNPCHVGLFGGHSPGIGNSLVQNSDLVIGFGVSLLQHQAGKAKEQFAPNAKIVIINRDPSEVARYAHDFGDRLTVIPADCSDLLNELVAKTSENKNVSSYWEDIPLGDNAKDWSHYASPAILNELDGCTPVRSIRSFLERCPQDYWAFSDAGATLSWTYQAANQCDSPPITTSFNLHTMGYSLPAAIGAATSGEVAGAFAISGDGGFMMNIQELSVAKEMNVPLKILILDNKGYGIIRQTQDAFLGGRHYGSDMGSFPSLPPFHLDKLTEAFGFETRVASPAEADDTAKWLFDDGNLHKVAIINIDPSEFVRHTTPNFKPLVY